MELSRRELVASFLGAAIAQAGCRRGSQPRPVPGALVDRAVQVGHRLKDDAGLVKLRAPTQPVEVLIVGAGVAGLSAGWRLRAAGVEDFLLCELEEAPGGTARSGENGVSAFPWGAHYLPAPVRDRGPVARLLRELGVLTGVDERGRPRFAEEALIAEPEERHFYRGHWYQGLYLRAGASASDLHQLARFEARMNQFSAARDGKGRPAFTVPTEECSRDAEWTSLDRLSMAQWLEGEGFSSERLRWLVDYACRDDFGARATDISAWAGIWYFAARASSDGAELERSEGYLSWPEGNGRLVRGLLEAVGRERVKSHLLVHTLSPGPEGCQVYAVDARSGAPLGFAARQVIFAGPQFVAGRVVDAYRRAPPAWLGQFEYGPWAVANLTVSAPPAGRGFPLSWDNVLYESQSLGYVVAGHQALRADAHRPLVLSWYYPLVGRDTREERGRLLATRYEDWASLVMADLRAAHPGIDALAQRLEVMRWGHAMVRPTPGFLFGGARQAAGQSLGALHFAHSDLGGMALFEEANWFGVRAAERCLSGLGRPVSSWL